MCRPVPILLPVPECRPSPGTNTIALPAPPSRLPAVQLCCTGPVCFSAHSPSSYSRSVASTGAGRCHSSAPQPSCAPPPLGKYAHGQSELRAGPSNSPTPAKPVARPTAALPAALQRLADEDYKPSHYTFIRCCGDPRIPVAAPRRTRARPAWRMGTTDMGLHMPHIGHAMSMRERRMQT
jgi:hypothetical protein